METQHTSLGWLGTGRMGVAMAGRLLDAGEHLTVWNRTRAKTEPLATRGAAVADTVADLGRCDVVFVMVTTAADLAQVVGDLLQAPDRPAVIVDCSTVSSEASAAVRAQVTQAGVAFLAAPVSGNPHMVQDGQACIVVSGPAAAFDRVRAHLEQMARVVVHAGEEEQSRLVKLCHNLYLGIMVQALAEVTTLAEKGGTDRAAFLEFLNGTVLASDWVRRRTPDLLAEDWTPTFTMEYLRKDFDLALGAARELEVPMPVGADVHQLIQAAIGTGLREQDFLSLYAQQARFAALDGD